MTVHRRSRTSSELLKVAVDPADSPAGLDVTSLTVEVAVMVEGSRPSDSDYKPGTWQTIRGITYACVLVGPLGAIQLADTDEYYVPWVRITSGSEKPEMKSLRDVVEVY